MISPVSNSRQELLSEISAVNLRVMNSFAQRKFSELASCYTEEAQVLVANIDPIVGREKIAAVHAQAHPHLGAINHGCRERQSHCDRERTVRSQR
jgi:ketosteroid isomerase-like protein